MKTVIFTPVRLLGDGLAQCLGLRTGVTVVAVVASLLTLRRTLEEAAADIALIDVTQDLDLEDVGALAIEQPKLALVALGLNEQRHEVIRCGRAGFSGYVPREAKLEDLCAAMADAIAGRLACPPEISSGLLQALFRRDAPFAGHTPEEQLTRREGEVLRLIGEGLCNKEIARELRLSLATVKHHVHKVLTKLQVARRSQAMRRVRDDPPLACWPPQLPDDQRASKVL